ncbi:MAG: outer membrane protein transport protein [Alistipes sp.]|nr:outer membrane protein transport protein [Alistipes sp.]
MKKILLLTAAAAMAATASAEGYQVNNMSARQTAMGHVGTAMKLNSESIFFNPAAASFQQSQFDLSAGFTGILSNVRYRALPDKDNGYTTGPIEKSDNKLSTPLHVYFNYKPIDRLAVGVGFFTPYGSSMNWGDNWSGAHLVQQINLKAFTVQPTLSFKICDRLSIGAGLMITWGNFDLSRSMLPTATGNLTAAGGLKLAATKLQTKIDQLQQLPATPETAAQIAALQGYVGQAKAGAAYFASHFENQSIVSAKLEGDAKVAIGVNAGILWDITDEWSVGMTWRSRMNMKVDKGHASLNYASSEAQNYLTLLNTLSVMSDEPEVIPGLDRGTFNAELPLPTVVTWGVSFRPTPKWEVGLDLQWNGWSAYKTLNVEFNETELGIKPIVSEKNYSNTLAIRLGGQYKATDWLTARMGMYVDESPVDSKYLNPETPSMTKAAYTVGLGFRPAKFMTIDLAYSFVSSADPERTGSYPIYQYGNPSQLTDVFSGNYKLHANVFSIGVGFHF